MDSTRFDFVFSSSVIGGAVVTGLVLRILGLG